ncbi:hypothetical protein EGR_10086 [Echinococcus granulosus]|uniref:Uncharacterized protein n=1 Tax=Echinococcus granulosus TaxID=6210 RepID=W6U1T4_ECHGR|nr:hypothetical protein EGR_10086 [Echinococcus granulosus]EUB55065.1 hypothetical protein EGR_10086 [Echinococcus granulosus]
MWLHIHVRQVVQKETSRIVNQVRFLCEYVSRSSAP